MCLFDTGVAPVSRRETPTRSLPGVSGLSGGRGSEDGPEVRQVVVTSDPEPKDVLRPLCYHLDYLCPFLPRPSRSEVGSNDPSLEAGGDGCRSAVSGTPTLRSGGAPQARGVDGGRVDQEFTEQTLQGVQLLVQLYTRFVRVEVPKPAVDVPGVPRGCT